jgi:hypothetical protein
MEGGRTMPAMGATQGTQGKEAHRPMRATVVARRFGLAVVVLVCMPRATVAQDTPASAPTSPPPTATATPPTSETTTRTWYGWEILLAAAASGGLFAGAELASDQSTEIVLGTFAYLTGLFGGPGVHYLNGRPTEVSRLSLQIAGGGGGLGILIGAAAAAGQRSQPYAQDIAVGCEIGLVAGMFVDAVVLGWKRADDRKVGSWLPRLRLERGAPGRLLTAGAWWLTSGPVAGSVNAARR